jgi:hypothetical protein
MLGRELFMAINVAESSAYKLLRDYRIIVWRKSAFESVQGTTGSKALHDCNERIRLTNELVEELRNGRHKGEELYWTIFITFLAERQPCDVNEILSDIATNHETISRSAYYRLKERAINLLNKYLEANADK